VQFVVIKITHTLKQVFSRVTKLKAYTHGTAYQRWADSEKLTPDIRIQLASKF